MSFYLVPILVGLSVSIAVGHLYLGFIRKFFMVKKPAPCKPVYKFIVIASPLWVMMHTLIFTIISVFPPFGYKNIMAIAINIILALLGGFCFAVIIYVPDYYFHKLFLAQKRVGTLPPPD